MSQDIPYDWVVVGGGLQGCYFATLLQPNHKIAILDPHPRLLHRWLYRSAACRMAYMRSASVHHLAPQPNDLRRFAQLHGYGRQHFTQPYLRPSLALFNAHCQEVLQRFQLNKKHLQGELYRLEYQNSALWQLEYCANTGEKVCLYSRNVLLALGDQGEYWGEWQPFQSAGEIGHISSPEFCLDSILANSRNRSKNINEMDICLIGKGISSAHLALYLLEQNWNVQIYSQNPIEFWPRFQFDSEPGWLKKFLPQFWAETNLQKRWQIIMQERHKGSITPQQYQKLYRYMQNKKLLCSQINALPKYRKGRPTVLATGLYYETPSWLLALARKLDLPLIRTAQGEKPALQGGLEWHYKQAPGLYLAGRLAELFLGPAAGNIAGARLAARYLPV